MKKRKRRGEEEGDEKKIKAQKILRDLSSESLFTQTETLIIKNDTDIKHEEDVDLDLLLQEGVRNPCATIPQPILNNLETDIDSPWQELTPNPCLQNISLQRSRELRDMPTLVPLTPSHPPSTQVPLTPSHHPSIIPLSDNDHCDELELPGDLAWVRARFNLERPAWMKSDLWSRVLRFHKLVEVRLEARVSRALKISSPSPGQLNKLKVARPRPRFSCFGCSFSASRITGLWNHINQQTSAGLEYECLRCRVKETSRCAFNNHDNVHIEDAHYNQQVDGGIHCAECNYNVRCKSYPAHKEIVHNSHNHIHLLAYQHNLPHWREWFHGK